MSELEKNTMRRQQFILGWLCTILPFASILFGLIGIHAQVNYIDWWYSISATFYANSNIIMIGLLFNTFIYFWAYKGYDKTDDIITKICAIAALGIIVFPTYTDYRELVGLFCLPPKISHIIHCCCALTFYIGFLLIICRFRLSNGNPTEKKKLRNKIYFVCGFIVLINILLIFVKSIFHWPEYTMIIFEVAMQISCGLSWLIKSEAFKFLND